MREDQAFTRGDASADGNFDVSDPIFILRCLFLVENCTICRDAADANDDGLVNIADPVYLLLWRFSGGPPPPPPFTECGVDPTRDDLDECESFSPCS